MVLRNMHLLHLVLSSFGRFCGGGGAPFPSDGRGDEADMLVFFCI